MPSLPRLREKTPMKLNVVNAQPDDLWVKVLYAWVKSKFSEANIDGPELKDCSFPRYHRQKGTDDRMGVFGNSLLRLAGEPRSLR